VREAPNEKLLPAREVLQRYSITDRTLARWLLDENLKFPPPFIVNHRRYFSAATLAEWERQHAKRLAAAKKRPAATDSQPLNEAAKVEAA
jgi:hypothetical protein